MRALVGIAGAIVEAWTELRIHRGRVLLSLIGVAVAVGVGVAVAVGVGVAVAVGVTVGVGVDPPPSAAIALPASRRAPTQKGGESAIRVPAEVAVAAVRGAAAV